MKKLIFALSSCLCFGAFADIPAGYVTEGLSAYWDAIDNQGTGSHDAAATTWVDIVGNRTFQLTGTTWEDKCLKFAGSASSYGAMTDAAAMEVFDSRQAASKHVTVELVFKYDDATTSEGVIIQAQSAAKVAIGRMFSALVMYYSSRDSGDVTGLMAVPRDAFYTVAVPYYNANGEVWVSKDTYHNASVPSYWNPKFVSGASDSQVTLGMTTAGGSCFKGRLYAVRVYNCKLTADQVRQNYNVDKLRYLYEPAGTVVAGTVTVGGTVFTAGETILFDPAASTLTIDDATDATLSLDATGLELTKGTVALANGASRTLERLDNLTVGADATLRLPSDGLYVTGTLTAEAGATVKGPGTLIGTAATCPAGLTLADGATYLCATGSSFTWPSSGVAYIPAGVVEADITTDDVAKIAGLEKIVFLGEASTVTYKLAEAWTFAVPVEGPGTVSVANAGQVTILGDNRNLTGCFTFDNTPVVVSNRYGLGSAVTKACTVKFGDLSDALRFGGAGLTNDVPLQVYKSTVANGLVLGPDNADETLVLNGGFLVMDNENIYLYLRNRIRIGGGVFGLEKKQWHYINALTDPVELWFDRDSKMRGDKMLWYGNIQMHIGWDEPERIYFIALYTGINSSAAPSMTFCGDELLYLGYITGTGTLNLNGHDQSVPMISRQYGSPLHVTSATPAVLKVTSVSTEDNSKRMNVAFSGAAGFNYSVPGTITNELFDTYSDTTGPLTVSTGALRVTGKAGWGGTNVTVCAGARLIVASAAAPHMFGDKKVLGHSTTTDLAVEKGGVLELEDGTATVRSYAYDGAFVPAGNYTSASGVGIEGAGVLRVRSSAPCEPGLLLIFR